MASGASLRHRAHKFVKRHSVAVAAGALFVISLIAGIVTTSWQAHVAMLERERAERRWARLRKRFRASPRATRLSHPCN
jgi:eukaryotic-like serine/threonine-protein kinase